MPFDTYPPSKFTSSFYMQSLPDYIQKINDNNTAQNYLKGNWEVDGEFKHNLDSLLLQKGGSAIKKTPFGNTILNDLALEILKKEKLGSWHNLDCIII